MKTKNKIISVGLMTLVGFFAGAHFASAQVATTYTCNSAVLAGQITSTSGVATNAWFSWGTTPSVGTITASQVFYTPQYYTQAIAGLSQNTTYYYQPFVSNEGGTSPGNTLSFTTPSCGNNNPIASVPTVTTNSASSIGQISAMFNGYVNANGSSVTAWFEYGTSQSFGYTTNSQNYGNTSTNISGGAYNLTQNTTYYYRAVAQNSQGTVYGSTLSFTTTGQTYTQASVTTNSASSIGQNSATLNGYVNGNGSNVNAWFEYGTSQSFGYTTNNQNYGNTSSSISGTAYNLAQNTTYYYRAVAQGSQGNVYGSTLSFTTTGGQQNYGQSYVSTNAATGVSQSSATLNGYMTSNGTNTSGWFEWGTSYSLGNTTSVTNYGSGSTSFNSSIYNLNSNTTYYYRAVAQSSYGTVYGSTISFTTGGQTYVTGTAPAVTTLLATEITGSTALLNGLVFASNNQNSNAWYEWGTTANLGNKTPSIAVGALPTVKHSDYITGLVNGQTYYYRIVGQNSYGTQYGTIYSFISKTATVVVTPTTPVVYKPVTTVVTQGGVTQSLVMLTIEGGSEMVVSGEKRTYHVTWKNISGKTLSNVVLSIAFPQSMTIESATKGTYASADNSVVVDLETLAIGQTGDTFIFTTVGRNVKAGDTLVVAADMVFTAPSGVQGDAIAYVTHTVQAAQNAISASVFGAGDFTPTTLLGWMSLLVLVLLMVFLGSHLYGKFSD
ncbi:MAG: hypothetical protein WC791_01580 [Candidatus Paceibacterota bacterium]|jgi:hypothetical protein